MYAERRAPGADWVLGIADQIDVAVVSAVVGNEPDQYNSGQRDLANWGPVEYTAQFEVRRLVFFAVSVALSRLTAPSRLWSRCCSRGRPI